MEKGLAMISQDGNQTKTKRFYRFRPLKRLLGERGELSNQTIFFPHPGLLNDPMEGYADIFWKGDGVLWRNLFRHYLRVLSNCFLFSRISSRIEDFEERNYFIMGFTQDFQTENAREIFEEISSLFFSCVAVGKLVDILSKRKTACTEDELVFHLETIHDLAYAAVFDVLQRKGLIPQGSELFQAKCLSFAKDFNVALYDGLDGEDDALVLRGLFASARHFGESHNIYMQDFAGEFAKVMMLLAGEFPAIFLREVRRLIYPDWYAACFMGDYRNASVWGTYGDNYTGVCLVFNAQVSGGESTIELLRKNSHGFQKNVDGSIVERSGYQYRKMRFHQIDYVAKHVQVDFFKSLGRLPISVLESDWYTYSGVSSTVAHVDDSDEFRKDYWGSFQKTITKKLSDWSHEDEHRLILFGMELSFSNSEDRLLKYRFDDLEGIIFGMRTPPEQRREIVALIKEKCKASGRSTFSFYQSYYSQDTGKIEIVPVPMLKI